MRVVYPTLSGWLSVGCCLTQGAPRTATLGCVILPFQGKEVVIAFCVALILELLNINKKCQLCPPFLAVEANDVMHRRNMATYLSGNDDVRLGFPHPLGG